MNARGKMARPDPHRGQILSFVRSRFAFFPVFLPTGTLFQLGKMSPAAIEPGARKGEKKGQSNLYVTHRV